MVPIEKNGIVYVSYSHGITEDNEWKWLSAAAAGLLAPLPYSFTS